MNSIHPVQMDEDKNGRKANMSCFCAIIVYGDTTEVLRILTSKYDEPYRLSGLPKTLQDRWDSC